MKNLFTVYRVYAGYPLESTTDQVIAYRESDTKHFTRVNLGGADVGTEELRMKRAITVGEKIGGQLCQERRAYVIKNGMLPVVGSGHEIRSVRPLDDGVIDEFEEGVKQGYSSFEKAASEV